MSGTKSCSTSKKKQKTKECNTIVPNITSCYKIIVPKDSSSLVPSRTVFNLFGSGLFCKERRNNNVTQHLKRLSFTEIT